MIYMDNLSFQCSVLTIRKSTRKLVHKMYHMWCIICLPSIWKISFIKRHRISIKIESITRGLCSCLIDLNFPECCDLCSNDERCSRCALSIAIVLLEEHMKHAILFPNYGKLRICRDTDRNGLRLFYHFQLYIMEITNGWRLNPECNE